ncbi:MAG TPA: hypothetical protein GX519_05900, partial [Thermoanaerobacterales bacterium]|nr:hypothetical protein [Thermoanaerobacterales bacterium]
MLKKIGITLIAFLLLTQVFSSFTLAADNSTYYYSEDEIQSFPVSNYKLVIPTKIQFDSFYKSNYYYNTQTIYQDFDGDGVYEVAVISYSTSGDRYLEIYKIIGQKMIRIFSGKGASIRINTDSFSISNVKYDGRYFYETYTYQWGKDKFLRTGYAKTYIKSGYIDYERPIYDWPVKVVKDARTLAVTSFLKARMQGDYD